MAATAYQEGDRHVDKNNDIWNKKDDPNMETLTTCDELVYYTDTGF